jgi:hypothetical protein
MICFGEMDEQRYVGDEVILSGTKPKCNSLSVFVSFPSVKHIPVPLLSFMVLKTKRSTKR